MGQSGKPGHLGIRLEAALVAGASVQPLRAMLVARNGRLVGERYYGGATASDLLAINSATKSVCSMLVGQALHQGKLQSLSQTVAELLPESARKFPDSPVNALTLSEILSGTTGLAYDFAAQYCALRDAADPMAYVYGLGRDANPRHPWSYNDAAISLLTPILERAYALPLADIAKLNVFVPLGIARFSGAFDKTGHALAYAGLRLRPRDLLKLAWLMADGGRWNGAQVLPAEWVAGSTRPHVVVTWRNPPIADTGYGYLWFTGTLKGKPVVWAWGYGGQFALFMPSLRLAVATSATDPAMSNAFAQTAAVMGVVAQVVDAAG